MVHSVYTFADMLDEEGKTERVTTRITPTARKKLNTISEFLGLSESETIRVILDDSLGTTSEDQKRVWEKIRVELKELTFTLDQLQALKNQSKDARETLQTLSDSKAYKAGLKKTKEPGFGGTKRLKVKS